MMNVTQPGCELDLEPGPSENSMVNKNFYGFSEFVYILVCSQPIFQNKMQYKLVGTIIEYIFTSLF